MRKLNELIYEHLPTFMGVIDKFRAPYTVILSYTPNSKDESNLRFWKEVNLPHKETGKSIEYVLKKLSMCESISECELGRYGALKVQDKLTGGKLQKNGQYHLHLKPLADRYDTITTKESQLFSGLKNFDDKHKFYPNRCFEMYTK